MSSSSLVIKLLCRPAKLRADSKTQSIKVGGTTVQFTPDPLTFSIGGVQQLKLDASTGVLTFRTGDAPPPLPWAPEGRAEYNRPAFLNLLGTQWLPAIADVDQRLRRKPPARVADLACGAGWSSIAIAQAYPMVRVDGFDLDPDVIAAARRNA